MMATDIAITLTQVSFSQVSSSLRRQTQRSSGPSTTTIYHHCRHLQNGTEVIVPSPLGRSHLASTSTPSTSETHACRDEPPAIRRRGTRRRLPPLPLPPLPLRSSPPEKPLPTAAPSLPAATATPAVVFRRRRSALHTVFAPAVPPHLPGPLWARRWAGRWCQTVVLLLPFSPPRVAASRGVWKWSRPVGTRVWRGGGNGVSGVEAGVFTVKD